jgi:hypothetical protein
LAFVLRYHWTNRRQCLTAAVAAVGCHYCQLPYHQFPSHWIVLRVVLVAFLQFRSRLRSLFPMLQVVAVDCHHCQMPYHQIQLLFH